MRPPTIAAAALGCLLVFACAPKGPLRKKGVRNAQVTTVVTVSCPGVAAQSERSAAVIVGCDEPGVDRDTKFAFDWQGTEVRCLITGGSAEHAADVLTLGSCSSGWALSHGVVVPLAYPFAEGEESTFTGTMTSGGADCTVRIEGPLFRTSIDSDPYCPCLMGTRTDAGCPLPPDGGLDGGAADAGDGGL
jgi:hypothetical protein